MAASRSRSIAAHRGTRSSCRSRRCITSRSTTRYRTTSTATGRTVPSIVAPSNARAGGLRRIRHSGDHRGACWQTVGGGESGWAWPDPGRPKSHLVERVGIRLVGGIVTRYDRRTHLVQTVEVWPDSRRSAGRPADLKYRFVWTAPFTLSSHDHNVLYVGSQYVHMTKDGGNTGQRSRPDLTPQRQDRGSRFSGGLTPDNIGVEYARRRVRDRRVATRRQGRLWAGTQRRPRASDARRR